MTCPNVELTFLGRTCVINGLSQMFTNAGDLCSHKRSELNRKKGPATSRGSIAALMHPLGHIQHPAGKAPFVIVPAEYAYQATCGDARFRQRDDQAFRSRPQVGGD